MSRAARTLLAGILLTAALPSGAAVASSAPRPLKITNCNSAVSRPKLLTLTCGDGNTVLKGLRWSSFGENAAKATGTFETNTCMPNCARGKTVSYPVSVKASSPRACKKGLRVYNKLVLTFTAHRPTNGGSLSHWTLGCPI